MRSPVQEPASTGAPLTLEACKVRLAAAQKSLAEAQKLQAQCEVPVAVGHYLPRLLGPVSEKAAFDAIERLGAVLNAGVKDSKGSIHCTRHEKKDGPGTIDCL